MREHLERGAECSCKKTAGTCRRLLKQESSLWTFVWVEGIEPTNNDAERVLRHAVLWRKSSGGTDSEAGSRFVTVLWDAPDGYSWDSHRSSKHLEKHLIPGFDQAFSALLGDLDERGLLDETLVVAVGEMGRTPKANNVWGRGHWSYCFPCVLAGAGIRGGVVYGESDKEAAWPKDRPVSPEDLAATIFWALGIDPEIRLPDRNGRPVQIVENGRPLAELFG